MKPSITRRELLRYLGIGSAGLGLAACQPKVVEVEKEVTKVVEVEKIVEQTVVVEKEVAKPAATGPIPILFWFQAENHKPEYESRIPEFNEKFGITMTFEILSRDAMNKKFPATLMAGSGFPDIIEMNADDVVKFLKGDDSIIPFLSLNEVLATSPYYEPVLESRWDRFTKDGNRYAAPHDVHPLVLLYHDVEWKKLDVDMTQIVTWDD